jgi:hypothetical protein
MKRTDLEKQLGHKINNRINNSGASSPFAKTGDAVIDRKEQRKKDKALGLLPFAVKLNEELILKIHALADERKTGVNELVAELLEKGMGK